MDRVLTLGSLNDFFTVYFIDISYVLPDLFHRLYVRALP
jgi:hypothetical protein